MAVYLQKLECSFFFLIDQANQANIKLLHHRYQPKNFRTAKEICWNRRRHALFRKSVNKLMTAFLLGLTRLQSPRYQIASAAESIAAVEVGIVLLEGKESLLVEPNQVLSLVPEHDPELVEETLESLCRFDLLDAGQLQFLEMTLPTRLKHNPDIHHNDWEHFV